jgi:hypothetical protein
MDEPAPALERVRERRGRGLPPVAAATVAIVSVTFLIGLALGGHVAPAPSPSPSPSATPSPTPSPSPSPPPAFAGAHLSPELWTAYLNRATGGWALCAVAATITCEVGISAVPYALFANSQSLPLVVSARDWAQLSTPTVPSGHYILAGPTTESSAGPLVAPQVTLARISPAGVGTIIGPADQTVFNDVVWADLGSLEAGRYVAVVGAYQLSDGNPLAKTTASWVGWAIGFVVGTSP